MHSHVTALTLLLACLSMGARDCFGTLLVVAENRGRAALAAVLDGALDLANIVVTLVGAGTIISDGLTPGSAGVVAAMVATSVVGTYFWTKLAAKIGAAR